MNFRGLVNGLKSGEIALDTREHELSDMWLTWLENAIEEAEERYAKSTSEENNYLKQSFEEDLNIPGKMLNHLFLDSLNCIFCGKNLKLICVGDKKFSLMNTVEYWSLKEEKSKALGVSKYDDGIEIKSDEIQPCDCLELVKQKKLVSEIDVQTGVLVLQNFFRIEHLHSYRKDINAFERVHSINNLLGRNNLMQALAKENVGYGQMGNMAIDVWANGSDEILITEVDLYDWLEELQYELDDAKENPNNYSIDDITTTERKLEFYKKAIAELEENGFSCIGSISLSMWRWQCADEKILKDNLEPPVDEYDDKIVANVEPGRYRIEHYFDFTRLKGFGEDFDDPIFSRIKKIK